jgi:ribonuclease G
MEKQIIIDTDEIQERRVAIIEDQKLVEYYIERVDAHRHIGNLYKGKVSNIVTGIQAAFIDIGLPKNGFLHVQELDTSAVEGAELEDGNIRPANRDKSSRKITDILKEGQEVIVQVVKEPMGTKGCRLTTNVSLPGRFLVFLPCEEQIAVSRKIFEAEERKRLKSLAAEVNLPKGCGLIVRTAAEGCSEKAFINDAQYLIDLWKLIESEIKSSEAPALVHQELDLAQKIIRDSFSEDVAKIVVNCPEGHKHILDFVKNLVPGAAKQVHLYQGDLPIFAKWGVQKDIERALRRKVWLKCGGYLVIDQTEAMVAIDVKGQ